MVKPSQLPKTPLSVQTSTLRTTLLLSLGLSPLGCGGNALMTSSDETGRSAGAGAAGLAAATSAGSAGAFSIGGSSSTGGAGPLLGCENPTLDPVTKLTGCASGLQHRAEATECTYTTPPPPSDGGAGGEASASDLVACLSSSDCGAFHLGWCDFTSQAHPQCRAGCSTDEDCNGGVCACDGFTPGRCTDGDCRTDADCKPGDYCVPVPPSCDGPPTFHCITLRDECTSDAECQTGWACRLENGRHICVSRSVCGRPFLIASAARMAEIETRGDWLDATLSPDVRELSPVQRAQLAAHWARLGQMEHASIAAFARFNLQLLSLGAPSALIEACNSALADETAHARMCFALASAYGAAPVGPTRLDIERCFEDNSLTAIARLVLREGCLGETVASLEAGAAAEVATDSAAAHVLERIARDELCHAELAFKFLCWALTQCSPEARHELACEAAQQLADFESSARNGERAHADDRLAMHGLLGSDALRAIQLAAARDVARPLLAALFDTELSGAA